MRSTEIQKSDLQLNLYITELEYISIYLTHAHFLVTAKLRLHKKKESSQEITHFLMKMLGDTKIDKKRDTALCPFISTPPVGLEPTTS